MQLIDTKIKNNVLESMISILDKRRGEILEANKKDLEAFSGDDLKQTLGEDMTESVCPTFYWNGTSTHHVQVTGGPQLVLEEETGKYRMGKPEETIQATPLLCYRAG